jgi:hypothetical protein
MPTWVAGLIAVAAITVNYFSCMRPRLRRSGCAGSGSSMREAHLDAQHAPTPRRPRLRLFIGVAAGVAVVAVVGHCEPNLSELRASHEPHPSLSSLGSEFAVNAEYSRLVDGSSVACHEAVTTAVLPRSATASVGHGSVMAVLAITGWQAQPAVLAGRGPPGALGAARTGQDLLRRFCLARR